MIRTGLGFDVHPFVEKGPLFLGCTALNYDVHLEGHSDGDCIAHSIADGLLSAALRTSLGQTFPVVKENKGISGQKILSKVRQLLDKENWHIVNIDTTVIADYPVLGPYVDLMVKNTAAALGIDETYLMIKPRHSEGLFRDFYGIICMSVVLVER